MDSDSFHFQSRSKQRFIVINFLPAAPPKLETATVCICKIGPGTFILTFFPTAFLQIHLYESKPLPSLIRKLAY